MVTHALCVVLCLLGAFVGSEVADQSQITHRVEFLPAVQKPIGEKAREGIREWVPMTKSGGERFNCSLPITSLDQSDREEDNPEEIEPAEILEPLRGTCLFRVEGWWTYEFCWGKHIKQFHLEGKNVAAQFFLGHFNEEHSPTRITKPKALGKKRGIESPAMAAVMDQGTVCDLTGQPRKATVFFQCSEDKHTSFLSLRETATCEYSITIATPLVCDDSESNSGPQTDFPINCYPIGEEGQSSLPSRWKDAVAKDTTDGTANTPPIKYKMGQCFRHKRHNYRGVIIAADPVCLQTEAWIKRMGVDRLAGGRNQPFYHTFVDERDRPGGQVTYVAQEHIVIEKLEEPIRHPLVKDIFTGFADGQHEARGDVAISLMPADEEVPDEAVDAFLEHLSSSLNMDDVVATAGDALVSSDLRPEESEGDEEGDEDAGEDSL